MSSVDISETTLERPENPPLFFRNHLAENEKARMVIVHGLGEHSGRYLALAEPLVELGVSLWILDLRGHGQSGGGKGHVDSFDDYTRDVRQALDWALAEKPGDTKCFLLGHSMGGLVAILFALEHQNLIDGLIVSSPALGVSAPLPAIKKTAAAFLARLFPRLGIKNELDPQNISRDPEIVRKYIEDPLVHNRVSTNWYIQFLKAMEKAHSRAADIDIPVLIQAAGDDRLVSTKDVVAFFDKLTVPDQELKVYDDLYHEIYNAPEPDRQKVISELITWLADRIGG
jgi:alpha-beta hydrolase superfamily lysophospholipase